jgi:hypothetical protein
LATTGDHIHLPLNTSMHQEITCHVSEVVTELNTETYVDVHAVPSSSDEVWIVKVNLCSVLSVTDTVIKCKYVKFEVLKAVTQKFTVWYVIPHCLV